MGLASGLSTIWSWFSSILRIVFPQRGEVYTSASRTIHLSLFAGGIAALVLAHNRTRNTHVTGAPTKDTSNFNYATNRRKALQSLSIPDLTDKKKLANIKVVEGYNSNSRGHLLFYRCFLPQHKKPEGMLMFISGYNADTDHLYYVMGVELSNLGYIVFTYDHYGHGRSDGLWAYVHHFDYLVEDACLMTEFAKRQFGHSKMDYFLYGSSMGGAVALMVSQRSQQKMVKQSSQRDEKENTNPDSQKREDEDEDPWFHRWNGCVLSAPMIAIDPSLYPPQAVVWMLRRVIRPLFPTLQMPGVGSNLLSSSSRDAQMVKWLQSNPITYSYGIRTQTAESMLNACEVVSNSLAHISSPMLILHGEADKVTSSRMSEKLFNEAKSKDKSLKLFKGGYHLLFADTCKDEVYQVCLQWMKERSGHEVFRSAKYHSLTFQEKVELSNSVQT